MSLPSRKRRHYSAEQLIDRSEAVLRMRDELNTGSGPASGRTRAAPKAPAADERDYELVPTATGKILELCIAIPNSITNGASAVLKVYQAFLRSLPSDKTVFVICDEHRSAEIRRLFCEAGVQCVIKFVPFKPAREKLPFGVFEHTYTNWVRDPFVAVQSRADDGRVRLIEPFGFFDLGRRVDADIADNLAKARPLTSAQTTGSVFMGGNLLCATDHILIGADEVYHRDVLLTRETSSIEGDRETLIAERLRDHLHTSKSVIFVRTSAVLPQAGAYATTIDGREWREETVGALNRQSVQPIFHIDMFITPTGIKKAGKDIILVGDPGLAANQLKRVTTDAMMIPAFDEIADFLAQYFCVIRNPLPLVFMDMDQGKPLPERKWYFASYNNALVEADGDNRQVWLPNYGFGNWTELRTTDESNRKIWRELGFTVRDVGDCHPLAERRGGLHCVTNVIRRSRG